MGWTGYHREKGQTDREHLQNELCRDGLRIVECATITDGEYRVFYAAVRYEQATAGFPEGYTFGLVVLQKWMRAGYENYYRKEMDETMGPCYYDAPAKVLDALSPTDSDYATEWRAKCRERLAAKAAVPKVKPGDRVRFAQALRFGNGAELREFTFVQRSVFRGVEDGRLYRIPSWRKMPFEKAA